MPVNISILDGKCQGNIHEIGQTFVVEDTTPGGMCIGAWNAISPYVNALLYGGDFPWEAEQGFTIIHCPDPKGITIQLRRVAGCCKRTSET
jgi:uncharacterized repeat protein (TIGR04076 family)